MGRGDGVIKGRLGNGGTLRRFRLLTKAQIDFGCLYRIERLERLERLERPWAIILCLGGDSFFAENAEQPIKMNESVVKKVRALLLAPLSTPAASTSAFFPKTPPLLSCCYSMAIMPHSRQRSFLSIPTGIAPITTGMSLSRVSNPARFYGYRAHGPFAPERGFRFDGEKVLLDPYGLAVAVPDPARNRPQERRLEREEQSSAHESIGY